ncbi:hypothetical protein [Crocosphaera sp. Alani8]|uniref:hypothetical protein n=1 Tax=Crocosphaera sp. Alani8 TaxID=3038952 RepID=UPI00313B94F5
MSSEKPSAKSSNIPDVSLSSSKEMSQQELIDVIKNTITKLDLIVDKISDQEIINLPNQERLNALINSTEMLADSLESETEKNESQTVSLSEENIESEGLDEIENWEDDLTSTEANYTDVIEEPVRELEKSKEEEFDSSSNTKSLSVGKIAGILGLSIIILLSVYVFVFKPELPNLEIFERSSELSPPQIVETPSQLEEPDLPQPIKNIPSPQPKLTPEQSLIAALQKEITDLTNQYPEDLIGRIEANFLRSRLLVTVGDQWYDLTTKEQDNLGNNILERSQSLDFRKLEVLDSRGDLVARTPVVGNKIIIFKRSLYIQ